MTNLFLKCISRVLNQGNQLVGSYIAMRCTSPPLNYVFVTALITTIISTFFVAPIKQLKAVFILLRCSFITKHQVKLFIA